MFFAQVPIPLPHDIRLPPAPGIWPLAPGWWVLALLAALAIVVAGRWSWRRLSRRIRRRQLQTLFERSLAASTEPASRLAILSQLLRRAARAAAGDAVAQLTGEPWLQWLDGEDPQKPFTHGPGRALLHGPFQKPAVAAMAFDAVLPIVRQRFLQLAMCAHDRPRARR